MEKKFKILSQIIVLEDLLNEKEANDFYMKLLMQPIWNYGRLSEKALGEYPFWGTSFDTKLIEPKIKLIIDRVNKRLAKTSIKSLKPYKLLRIDGNALTAGSSGYPHIDANLQHAISLLLYGNPTWKAAWGGETKFFDDSVHEIVRSVMPKPGRAVLFPSRFQHAAGPLAPIFKGLRATLSLIFVPEKGDPRKELEKWKPTTRVRTLPAIGIARMLERGSRNKFVVLKQKRFIAQIQFDDTAASGIERTWRNLSGPRSVTVSRLSKGVGMPHDELAEYLSLLSRYGLITKR